MQNPFLYSDASNARHSLHGWLALRNVTANTGNIIAAPETFVIPDGGWTELIAVHDCTEFAFLIDLSQNTQANFAANQILIERSRKFNAALSGDVNPYSSISPTVNWSTLSWNSGQGLGGWFRIKNQIGGGLSCTVAMQKWNR